MPLRPNFIERFIINRGMVPGPLLDLGMSTFMATALIGAGKIGLFQRLGEGPAKLEELAERTGSNPRALETLLKTLEPLNYVKEDNDRWSLTKYAKRSFPLDSFHEMIPFFEKQMVYNAEGAEKALREAPEEGVFGWEKVKEGELGRSYQVTMRWLAGNTVDEVVGKIKLPRGANKMLDIGGSHGLYCVEMCRKYPGLSATVLDWEIGIENARETLERETDVADRIDTVIADYNKDDLPGGNDFVFLGNIIHGNSPEQNRNLFKKISGASKDNAILGIVDQFDNISGSKFARGVSALVGWNLFLFAGGRAYAMADVKKWLEQAGFKKFKMKPLKKSPGFSLLIAGK